MCGCGMFVCVCMYAHMFVCVYSMLVCVCVYVCFCTGDSITCPQYVVISVFAQARILIWTSYNSHLESIQQNYAGNAKC